MLSELLDQIPADAEVGSVTADGGYDAVRRYASGWSKAENEASAEAYVPLSFDPGEACQFDWR